jgi:hypothetical protein
MKRRLTQLFFFAILLLSCMTSDGAWAQQARNAIPLADTASKPPAFTDGGKTIANLAALYKCERIEFENWEQDDAVDSILTVCLINNKIRFAKSAEAEVGEMKAIARKVAAVISYPKRYKSYYIIFVKRGLMSGEPVNVHAGGSEFLSTTL